MFRGFKKNYLKKVLSIVLVLILFLANINYPVYRIKADEKMITIYLVDNTNEKWIGNDSAEIQLVDNTNGHQIYWMSKNENNVWSVRVPSSTYNITFNRFNHDKTIQWNSWSAGGRNSNNAYFADGAEYGHWVYKEDIEQENYFHEGDVVYLDLTDFVSWESDGALMYVNFTDATKAQNNGNDVDIFNTDKYLYNPKEVKYNLMDYIYSYTVTKQEEGKNVLRFWRGNSSCLWNCSVSLTYENYINGFDSIKVTGWDNTGYIFKSGNITDKNVDTDNDGLPDIYEISVLGTNPEKSDSDDNGISDGQEDFDGDGLDNLQEYLLKTNPFAFDTDNDGFSDNYEVAHGMNPLVYDEVEIDNTILYNIHDNTIDELELLNIDEIYPLELEFNDEYTQITSISGVFSEMIVESPIEAIYSIYSIKSLLGIDEPEMELRFNKLIHSKSGETYTFLQYYNGVEVYGSSITVSVDNSGKVTSLHSSVINKDILDKVVLNPEILENDLNNIILNDYVEIISFKLVLYLNKDNSMPELVYVVVAKKENDYVEDTLFINAVDGSLIKRYENILLEMTTGQGKNENQETVSFPVNKTGFLFMKNYTLEDTNRKIYVYNRNNNDKKYSSDSNTWSDPTSISAYTNVIEAYDWWKDNFDYVGIDGVGGDVKVYVHDSKYNNNAFYLPGNPSLHFCDTKNSSVTKASALDCIGHEYTHAIVSHNTNITTFDYEPATINEAYADIFGSLINNNTWRTSPRDIAVPENHNNPRVVGDTYYLTDFSEPHKNATIISHAAYLMQHSYNIDFGRLSILWYDSMAEGLDDNSDFSTVRNNVMKSARKNGFSYEEISNIRKAFENVGVTGDKGNAKISILNGETPVSNAKVTLINYGDSKNRTTNSLGIATFTDMNVGTNTVKIEVNGYEPLYSKVLIQKDKTVEIKINLLTSESKFDWNIYDHYNYREPFSATLEKHIITSGNDIKMIGYSAAPLKDFMLTNENDNNTSFVHSAQKIISFDIKRDANNWHTMEGGGFLFNVKTDDNKLYCHCILVTEGGLKLYSISNVDIDDFRNGSVGNISNVGTLIDTYNIGNVLDDHHITIRIINGIIGKKISVWDGDNIIIDDKVLINKYGNDFGPITSHTNHACGQISYFTFSNIQMSSISQNNK